MSPAQPDDQDEPRRSTGSSAAFDQIVARLRAEGGLPIWPEEPASAARQQQPEPPRNDAQESEVVERRAESAPRSVEAGTSRTADGDHFVPPEPPPLPPLGQVAAVGIALLALGVLLVVAPDLLGLSEAAGLTLGLITLAGGLGWLVLRAWTTDPPEDSDPVDDGARF